MQVNKAPLSPRLIYHWHVGMLASIAHRISGVFLLLCIPLYVYFLYSVSASPERFQEVYLFLHSGIGRMLLWLVSVALTYHFFNGIRFLCLDIGWGESHAVMRHTARLVFMVSACSAMVFGVLLW